MYHIHHLEIYIWKDRGCFSMMFDFSYTNFDLEGKDEKWYKRKTWTTEEFRELLFKSQEEIQKTGWPAVFIENHDQPRAVSKFFPDKKPRRMRLLPCWLPCISF